MMLEEIELDGLTDTVKHDLQILALEGMPNEVCGILHTHHIIHQYPNTFDGDHRIGFDMNVDLSASEIVAVWHSHPSGRPSPSEDDAVVMEKLMADGHNYPWIIVTSKSVKAWHLYPSAMRLGTVV